MNGKHYSIVKTCGTILVNNSLRLPKAYRLNHLGIHGASTNHMLADGSLYQQPNAVGQGVGG